jgi:hypothetical protein
MKTNVGKIDKVVRITLAIVFAALYFTGVVTGTVGTILLVLGIVFAATSLIGFCPLYAIFGMSTCPAKKS